MYGQRLAVSWPARSIVLPTNGPASRYKCQGRTTTCWSSNTRPCKVHLRVNRVYPFISASIEPIVEAPIRAYNRTDTAKSKFESIFIKGVRSRFKGESLERVRNPHDRRINQNAHAHVKDSVAFSICRKGNRTAGLWRGAQ